MSSSKQIVCLANSRKPGGRCIAGKEWRLDRKWIRPVSQHEQRSLSPSDRQYEGGVEPSLLDIINIPLLRHSPLTHQRENYLIDDKYYWTKSGRACWSDLAHLQDHPISLWSNNSSSMGYDNNRVSVSTSVAGSLFLIKPQHLDVIVEVKSSWDSSIVVKGQFTWRQVNHKLQVTDPIIEQQYTIKGIGSYRIAEPYLCISLGDPWQEHYYKLIAAVICK